MRTHFRNRIGKMARFAVACIVVTSLCAIITASAYEGGDHDPYVQNVTPASAVIIWQTAALSDSTVEYGLTTSYGDSVYVATYVNNHEITLPDLASSTVYHYRTIHDDGSGPVYSADSTFKTAPATAVSFSFAVIADSHKTPEVTEVVLPQVVSSVLSLSPDLVLHAGDFTDDGTEPDWNFYFFGTTAAGPMMGPLISKVAMYPTLGNHDDNRETYFTYFNLPVGGGTHNEQYYSHDYSNAHFVHLDTNIKLDGKNDQSLWLENDLASTTAEWIFVDLHDSTIGNAYMRGLCSQYGIDVVFAGHDHFYDRAYRDGTYYITAATAGGDPWNARPSQYSQYTESTSGFVSVDINGTTATFKGRYPDGSVFDTLVISHGADNDPPTPDPMTWATAPYATGSTSIAMEATTATDPSGVEYFFDCTSAGCNDSAWQDSTSYADSGLEPGTQYCYTVQARDKSPNQNATGVSTTECATTDTPVPPTDTPIPPTDTPEGPTDNLALNKSTETSSVEGDAVGANAVDGNIGTKWRSKKQSQLPSEWIKVDLEGIHTIDQVVLRWADFYAIEYTIQVSENGSDWSTVYSTSSGDGGDDVVDFAATSARYVMMDSTVWENSSERCWLYEYEVYGLGGPSPTDTPVPPTDTPIPPTDTPVPPTDTPEPGPTDTPAPPTDTPVPPTDTPIPPTDMPVPPTNTPGAGGTIFFDGFESGDFGAGGWTTSGSTASVEGSAAYTGNYGAELGKLSWIEVSVSTAGYTGIHLKYARMTQKLDEGEAFTAEWYDGSAWHVLESTRDTNWAEQDWTLPAGADNNPNFAIRFASSGGHPVGEFSNLDDVEVSGTQ